MFNAKHIDHYARLFIGCAMLICGFIVAQRIPMPDFAQDYAAAWGWWHGRDTNGSTSELLTACCTALMPYYQDVIAQTAHPPFATLLILPLGWLPWALARQLWLIIGCVAVVAGWQFGRVSPIVCAATAGFWVISLALGALEPLLFALLIAAFMLHERTPLIAGACIGICIALKVYPALLLFGPLIGGKQRLIIGATIAGTLALLLPELVLGPGVTLGWLAYVPINTLHWVDRAYNISLVYLVRALFPSISPMFVTLGLGLLLSVPLVQRLRQGDPLRPLLPVVLLASPLVWVHYIGLVALIPMARLEQICIAVAGAAILLVGLGIVQPGILASIAYGLILMALLLMWYRLVRFGAPRSTHLHTRQLTNDSF